MLFFLTRGKFYTFIQCGISNDNDSVHCTVYMHTKIEIKKYTDLLNFPPLFAFFFRFKYIACTFFCIMSTVTIRTAHLPIQIKRKRDNRKLKFQTLSLSLSSTAMTQHQRILCIHYKICFILMPSTYVAPQINRRRKK